MSTIYYKSKNGINLLKKSISVMLHMKIVAFFSFLILTCNLSILLIFLEIEYQQYGVHMFDHKTLKALISLSFWSHIGHTFLILATIGFASIITLFFRFCLSFIVTERLKEKNPSIIKILKIPFQNSKELLRMSFLRTIGFVLTLGNITYFSSHIIKIRHLAAETFQEEYDQYTSPEGMLLIPIIVEEDIHTVAALAQSAELLKQSFSQKMTINFSFWGLKLIIGVSSFLLVGGTMHFMLGYHVFPTIITCITLIISLASLIESAKILFDGAVYNYCKKLPIGLFSKENIIPMFTDK